MRSRRKFIIASLLLFAGGIAMVTLLLLRQARLERELRAALSQVQLAVERYAVDKEGTYPADLRELKVQGYLGALPLNPYTGETLKVLSALDEPQSGALVYLPFGPIIAIGNDTPGAEPILTRELDQYLLAVYRPINLRDKQRFHQQAQAWRAVHPDGLPRDNSKVFLTGQNSQFPASSFYQLSYPELVPCWELFRFRCMNGEAPNARHLQLADLLNPAVWRLLLQHK